MVKVVVRERYAVAVPCRVDRMYAVSLMLITAINAKLVDILANIGVQVFQSRAYSRHSSCGALGACTSLKSLCRISAAC